MTQPAARPAIIDIGSNSVRLVVYDGPSRAPAILFNEKVMAGLGRSLAATGAIDDEAMEVAVRALARFSHLCAAMGVSDVRTVATAAVREASNGQLFMARAEQLGLSVELLSGEAEAEAAALGVISAIPDADGIVGDLGGGSLELVRVRHGEILGRLSLPLGVLRIPAIRAGGKGALDRQVGKLLKKVDWLADARGLPFYLVGGSWRALARLDMYLCDYPLPILHQYRMEAAAGARLLRTLGRVDRPRLRAVPKLSTGRIATMADAARLLGVLARRLHAGSLVVSAYGLREGLLFKRLSEEHRAVDPLITACRDEGERLGRFREHGDLLNRWITPLFDGESASDARLRLATCLLADVGWRANPEFRAERGLETAVHGNWVGIDARGRAMMGQALFTSFGGGSELLPMFFGLCAEADLRRAVQWGLAIRLGQRLSGGVAAPLRASRIALDGNAVSLALKPADAVLYGDAVQRRHRQLAGALGVDLRVAEA
ncbi:Ppx/GppA family phosphatase [Sphingomonas sp. SCN 67-18]|uniref:Ppx/GppA family phosphatase n=1 Tax=uncultured Sphingomonas sp. TaxID=158754 RepID=UPI000ADC629D|nr:Ppx/GppA family phosphatase [Sphingomonas sp. SCN 67-18]